LYGGGSELQKDIYDKYDVVPIPVAVMPESGGHFLMPIPPDPDDFNATGWRLRWYGIGQEILANAFPGLAFNPAEAGAAPLSFFGDNGDRAEPYYPGQKLQGFEFATPNTDWDLTYKFGAAKVHGADHSTEPWVVTNPADAGARYYYKSWHQKTQIFEFWFNKGFWKRLGSEKQKKIICASRETLMHSVRVSQIDSLDKIESKIATAAAGDPYAVGIEWPSDILNELRGAADQLYQYDSAADPNIADILESMENFGWEWPKKIECP
jgi:TRAP-type mannitol/chloroaromatic compound transport system substrate-binding protein